MLASCYHGNLPHPVIGNPPVGNERQWDITRTSAGVWELADFVTAWGEGVVSCHPIPLSADLSSLIYISPKLSFASEQVLE